jgi:hypothetical protein
LASLKIYIGGLKCNLTMGNLAQWYQTQRKKKQPSDGPNFLTIVFNS